MSAPLPSPLSWDPEIDTPSTLAVIGGGACGVEAALYGRFLGYSVELFDLQKIGDSLLVWGERSLSVPWQEATSSLGLAALEAHGMPLPDLDQIPSCGEYVREYLLPLARCDLLHDSINMRTRVEFISRLGCDLRDQIEIDRRADQEFRLLLSSSQRGEYSQVVDFVLDCSGIDYARQELASGGGRPAGWSAISDRLFIGKFDLAGKHGKTFCDKRILMVGNDECAVANAIQWTDSPINGGRLYWVIPKRLRTGNSKFDIPKAGAMLTSEEVARAERLILNDDSPTVVPMSAWGIESVHRSEDELTVNLQVSEEETVDVRVDWIVHCGARLTEPSYQHRLHLQPLPNDSAIMQEPHFYLLGDRAVSLQREDGIYRRCTFTEMQQQIRRVFAMVGGRTELNLYDSVRPQAWN